MRDGDVDGAPQTDIAAIGASKKIDSRPLAKCLGELLAQGIVAGGVDDDDVGDALGAEVLQRDIEARFVEIEQQRHFEAEVAKLLRHGLGVVARIVELGHRQAELPMASATQWAAASACASAPRRTSTSSDRMNASSMRAG